MADNWFHRKMARLSKMIEALRYDEIKFQSNPDLIEYIDTAIDEAFVNSSIANASFNTPAEPKQI
jgi:phosphoglucomutase